MKVIVCGAGMVGSNIARYLSVENNEVTVVDQSPDLLRKIGDSVDVKTVVGHAGHPDILEQAGARDADMMIAVTYADEVNMIACQVAHSLFEVPTKIARVRAQSYLEPIWADLFSRNHIPIDVIISPEIEVARAIARRLEIPGAVDMIPLAADKVKVIGLRCDEDCPVINTPLRQLTSLFPDLHITVIAILRNERAIVPSADDQMLPGDEVYFVADSNHVARAMTVFGHEEPEARRVIIVGGGNIGRFLARDIERDHPSVNIKIIEIQKERAEDAARSLSKSMILHGDALDPEILEEANVKAAEAVVAVTNEDEVNILASLLAKRYGCQRAMTLINTTTYTPLITTLGIDVVVNPRAITVSTILQHVRRGRIRSDHSLRDGFGEVIELDALETSALVGTPLRDIRLPPGVIIGALVRGDDVVIGRSDTVIRANDRVILFTLSEAVRKVEKLLAVSLEFF